MKKSNTSEKRRPFISTAIVSALIGAVATVIAPVTPKLVESFPIGVWKGFLRFQPMTISTEDSRNWDTNRVEFLALEFLTATNSSFGIMKAPPSRTIWMKQLNSLYTLSRAPIVQKPYKQRFLVRQVNETNFLFGHLFDGRVVGSVKDIDSNESKPGFEMFEQELFRNVWGPEITSEPIEIRFVALDDPNRYSEWGFYFRFCPDLSMSRDAEDHIVKAFDSGKHKEWRQLERDLIGEYRIFSQHLNALSVEFNGLEITNRALDYATGVAFYPPRKLWKRGLNSIKVRRGELHDGDLQLQRLHILLEKMPIN